MHAANRNAIALNEIFFEPEILFCILTKSRTRRLTVGIQFPATVTNFYLLQSLQSIDKGKNVAGDIKY
jgi:hypothetical protein